MILVVVVGEPAICTLFRAGYAMTRFLPSFACVRRKKIRAKTFFERWERVPYFPELTGDLLRFCGSGSGLVAHQPPRVSSRIADGIWANDWLGADGLIKMMHS